MKIYNGTPHEINIVVGAVLDPTIRKMVGGEVIKTIPSSGMLNAKLETVPTGDVDGIPVFEMQITGCDLLPEGDYDIFVVSLLYAQAYTALHGPNERLYTVSQPVMSDDGRTFRGCVGLTKYAVR